MIEIEQVLLDLVASCFRVFVGFFLAFILALLLAVLRHQMPRHMRNHPLINFFFDLPKFPPPIAWIPFIVLALGIGEIAAVSIVVIGALPPLFTHLYDGLEHFPQRLLRLADSLQIKGSKRLIHIYARSLLGQVLTGAKMALAMAWMSVIASEMVSGQSGLGHGIQMARVYLDFKTMALYMFLIGLMGFLFYHLIEVVRRRVVKWQL